MADDFDKKYMSAVPLLIYNFYIFFLHISSLLYVSSVSAKIIIPITTKNRGKQGLETTGAAARGVLD